MNATVATHADPFAPLDAARIAALAQPIPATQLQRVRARHAYYSDAVRALLRAAAAADLAGDADDAQLLCESAEREAKHGALRVWIAGRPT